MPTHSYNFGVRTSAKGIIAEAVRISIGAAGAPTIAEDCRSNLIASVTHTATGVYTFQYNVPFPPKVIVQSPELAQAQGAAIIQARYRANSYNATTGQFIIDTIVANGTATDPNSGEELHVLVFNRLYTT